ncbi:M16 family metallopeptidase [Cognataquiflexum nitidum]|uniref:M16 family metallopeptidase n=1 Tax=Cognataquiflexum nitidum TaxID=2922272 RepID=UPI002107633C|nr:pitrilysin family protein [Cognataquiflexum nitidum]
MNFIPTPEIDAVKLEISSSINESTKNKLLVPYFALEMVTEGTASKDAAALDDFFDTYASEVETESGFENHGLSILTTKKHFNTVLPVFRELLTEAIFPEKELSKRKKQKALSIHINRDKNSHRASQLFRKVLFGEKHPYGQITEEKDVDIVEREDLIDFYKKDLWTNSEIFLTGNLNDSQLEDVIRLIGNIPVSFFPNPESEFQNQCNQRVTEGKPKSVQSSIRIGCHLISKSHPDYFKLNLMNTILGGYFGSRLIKNIREDKGHTYGIYSSIGGLKHADYWVVMADVIKEHDEAVIEEVYKEIDKLKNEPVSNHELEVVRNYMVGKLLSQFSSGFELIGRYKSIHQAGLDFGFYQQHLAYILNATAEDIMEVSQKYLEREKMVEIIVG